MQQHIHEGLTHASEDTQLKKQSCHTANPHHYVQQQLDCENAVLTVASPQASLIVLRHQAALQLALHSQKYPGKEDYQHALVVMVSEAAGAEHGQVCQVG